MSDTKNQRVCPYCKKTLTGISFSVDASPQTGSLAVATFVCEFCRSVLSMCFIFREDVAKLKP